MQMRVGPGYHSTVFCHSQLNCTARKWPSASSIFYAARQAFSLLTPAALLSHIIRQGNWTAETRRKTFERADAGCEALVNLCETCHERLIPNLEVWKADGAGTCLLRFLPVGLSSLANTVFCLFLYCPL